MPIRYKGRYIGVLAHSGPIFVSCVSHKMISVRSIDGWGPARNATKPIVLPEISLKMSESRCVILKFSSVLRQATLCVAKSSLMYANNDFA